MKDNRKVAKNTRESNPYFGCFAAQEGQGSAENWRPKDPTMGHWLRQEQRPQLHLELGNRQRMGRLKKGKTSENCLALTLHIAQELSGKRSPTTPA